MNPESNQPQTWWHIRHRSTYTYVAWAGLYFLLGAWMFFGGRISRVFGENLGADIVINLASPFILGGGLIVANLVDERFAGVPWLAWPFLAALCGATIVVPAMVIFHLGGWGALLGAALFFSRVNWFFFKRSHDIGWLHLFARGLWGPFAFFAPALAITCLVLQRNTVSVHQTDWVPLFGVIYFCAQAGFEELMLRRAARMRSSLG
jgi:hypothetical protein